MENSIQVSATERKANGKGPARRLRASGKLPAVLYGGGKSALALAVDPKAVRQVLTAPLGRNTVFTLDIEGKKQLAMVKSFDIHPMSREIEHADLYEVHLEHPVFVEVPLNATGKAKGVATGGGILRQVFRKLPIKCTPDKIPAKIDADVSNLDLGQTLATKDLILPEGVSVTLEASQTLMSVVAPEKEVAAAAVPGAPVAAAAAAPAGKDAKAPAGKDAKAAAPAAKDAKAAAPAAKKK